MQKSDEAIDSRFLLDTAKPKKKRASKIKEMFYWLEKIQKDVDRCAMCGFPLAGPTALFIALLTTGPFCRPECIIDYYDLKKVKLKEAPPVSS